MADGTQGGVEPPRLALTDVRDLVSDADELRKGTALYDQGGVENLARHGRRVYGEVRGAAAPYRVQLAFGEHPRALRPRCTCFAARSRPFCKHAVALLVAWARDPGAFAVSEGDPGGAEEEKRPRRPRAARTDKAQVMAQGVGRVVTLVRELALSGVAGLDEERLEQIRTLGEGLREHQLRRLSARTIELAALLKGAAERSADFCAGDYADHLCDMLLTARKLEKHLGGEPLDPRHVEELVGKTWTDKERQPASGLHLVEYAFLGAQTPDGFVVRESRLFDLASGQHYSEKQIVPAFLRNIEPKRSYQGEVLLGAGGSVFPGFPPLRLKLADPGTRDALGQEALAALCGKALPGVAAALAAFQEQRKDLFAPTRLPVAVRVHAVLGEGATLRILDEAGGALPLPAGEPGLEARLGTLLRGARLRVLLGEIDVEEALPTLFPLSAVVEAEGGLSLRPLTAPRPTQNPQAGRSRRRASLGGGGGRGGAGAAHWADRARALGASPAAVALEEVRDELAQALAQGLVGLGERTAEPLALRLQDLGLGKPAALLRELPARPDPAGRLDDFVKVYQVLEIALLRLAGAAQVPVAALTPVPTYEGVYVRPPAEALPPREVMIRRGRGELGRYEAALHYARYYEALSAAELLQSTFPTWADGGALPFLVHALTTQPDLGEQAVAAAERALRGKSYMAKLTAVELLRALRGERATMLLAQVAEGEHGRARPQGSAAGGAQHAAWYWEHGGTIAPLRVLARDAIEAAYLQLPTARGSSMAATIEERRRRHARQLKDLLGLLGSPYADQRVLSVQGLAKLGDLHGAAPALRVTASADESAEVREAANLALGLLGDWEMVEHFVLLLANRAEEPGLARAAALALGYLGDARGIHELLAVFAEGWSPQIMTEALRAVGEVMGSPLLDLLWRRPELLTRKAVPDVLRALPAAELAGLLASHLRAHVRGQRRAGPAETAEAEAGGSFAEAAKRCAKIAAQSPESLAPLRAQLEALAELDEAERAQALAALGAYEKKQEAPRPAPKRGRGTQMM